MPPFMYGGDMVIDARVEGCKWNSPPHKFEAGTPNICGIIATGAAVDYLNKLGMDNIRAHELWLLEYAIEKLQAIEGIDIYGPLDANKRTGVIAFNIQGLSSIDLASFLDDYGIAIRSGHHCAQPIHDFLKILPSARISFYFYNTKEEIDFLVPKIEEVRRIFL